MKITNSLIKALNSALFFTVIACNGMQAPKSSQIQKKIYQPADLRHQVVYNVAQGILNQTRSLSDLQKLPLELQNYANLLIEAKLDLNQALILALLDVDIQYSYEDIRNLLTAGADCNITIDSEYSTPLHYAIRINLPWLFDLLIEFEAETEVRNAKGYMPINYACENTNTYFFSRLLALETDNNKIEYYKRCGLLMAATRGNIDLVQLLLDRGSKSDAINSALQVAAAHGHKDIVFLLLTHGADINQIDEMGRTVLHYACAHVIPNSNKDIVSLLLAYGADINQIDEMGKTALFWATSPGDKEVVSLLLDNGATMDLENKNNNPFIKAARGGHIDILKLFLERCAIDQTTIKEAMEWADFNEHFEVGYFLLDKLENNNQ